MSITKILLESGSNKESVATEEGSRNLREAVILEAKGVMESHEGWSKRYENLNKMIESVGDMRKQTIAATTLIAMNSVKEQLKKSLRARGLTEETVAASLGPVAPLTPRVTDIVGIFYPNLIAQLVTDIQMMDRSTGEIFVMQPIYSNTRAGVSAGDEVFVKNTDGTYASEENFATQELQVTSGKALSAITIPKQTWTGNIQAESLKITVRDDAGIQVVVAFGDVNPDGEVNLVDTEANVTIGGVTTEFVVSGGAVTYTAATNSVEVAAITLTPNDTTTTVNADVTVVAELTCLNDYESNPATIPELEIKFRGVPVTAIAHPLRYKVSDQSLFVAQSHLDIDLNDEMTTLCAAEIQRERDLLLVRKARAVATHLSLLDFNASMTGVNYPRDIRWGEIGANAQVVVNAMIDKNGRGGLSYVLAGANAAVVWTKVPGFEANPEAAPSVGPYVAGYFNNGTVPVICVPTSSVLPANDYIVGYKGFRVGDSAIVLAEWIPLFFSALWDSPNLTNERGLMSLYALFVNRAQYIYTGTISGFMS